MEIFYHPDEKIVLQKAREELNNVLKERKGRPILFLFSGGSSLKILDGVKMENLGEDLTAGVLDERFSKDENINQFAQITKTPFYKNGCLAGVKFIDTQVKNVSSPVELAYFMEQELRDWRKENPEGFVLITQGVGEDGHTAGMAPYPENPEFFREKFEDSKKWVVSYDAGGKNKYPLRVTVTISFLRDMVDYAIVFITGEKKKGAFLRVMSQEGSLRETPARILLDMKKVKVFTNIKK